MDESDKLPTGGDGGLIRQQRRVIRLSHNTGIFQHQQVLAPTDPHTRSCHRGCLGSGVSPRSTPRSAVSAGRFGCSPPYSCVRIRASSATRVPPTPLARGSADWPSFFASVVDRMRPGVFHRRAGGQPTARPL